MRKNIVAFSSLVLTLIVLALLVRPGAANISTTKWLEPTFSGTDAFYGSPAPTIMAYEEGSTAKLVVSVTASPYSWINVTWVRISFDWGKTYNSTEADGVKPSIEINATSSVYVFNIAFTAPSTTVVSNLIRHSYTITVSFEYSGGNSEFTTSASDFVIYSTVQADAQTLNQQVDAYGTWSFSSSEAQVLWQRGKNAATSGDAYYKNGDFTNAVTSYQSALNYYNQSFDAEKTYQNAVDTALTTAQSNYYNALANNASIQADASKTQADAALTSAYGWLSFGIGWILIGIGAIIYGVKKPKPPA
jgi:hypothetical protein